METALNYLEKLTHATSQAEEELMAKAFRLGLRQLWREYILKRYLGSEISRAQAIDEAGIDWVKLAEKQQQAVQEDLQWALKE
ncbi:MAG: hypothetical protein GY862_28985 [Gammaproteobacteria bacterium]|nr:hypothetical protein [Gammaproteobacteria bacterium]